MSGEPLEKITGYHFHDEQRLRQALTHRSASGPNNERLEFLGDSILNFVIADELFARRGEAREGELSRLRANLVNERSLAAIARDIGLGGCIRLGGGEMKSGGHRRDSILADAVEALLGAIHLDGGFAEARAVVCRLYADRLASLPSAHELKDAKTRLQEYLQGRSKPLPEYRVTRVSGEAHDQVFAVICDVSEPEHTTEGRAPSRRKAEQRAAAAMLERLLGEDLE